jgi:hypothetical protein
MTHERGALSGASLSPQPPAVVHRARRSIECLASFSSYCPSRGPSTLPLVSGEALPRLAVGESGESQPANRPDFPKRHGNSSARGMSKVLRRISNLDFIFRADGEPPYEEQRTSYGLYNRASCRMPGSTAPLGKGRCPVASPPKRGQAPSVGYSPEAARRRGIA